MKLRALRNHDANANLLCQLYLLFLLLSTPTLQLTEINMWPPNYPAPISLGENTSLAHDLMVSKFQDLLNRAAIH